MAQVIAAVGAAQAAQEELVGVALATRYPPAVREAALTALLQLRCPSAATMGGVVELAADDLSSDIATQVR